jgi:hypothetical protein
MNIRSIIAFALFTICIVFSYFFIVPNVKDVTSLRLTFARNREDATKALERFKATQAAIGQFQNLSESSLDLIEAALPRNAEVADLYVITDNIVARSGLVGGDINISSSRGRNFLGPDIGDYVGESFSDVETVGISFRAAGDYETLKLFLKLIEGHLRLFDVESVNLSTAATPELGSDVLSIGMQIRTYYDTSYIKEN